MDTWTPAQRRAYQAAREWTEDNIVPSGFDRTAADALGQAFSVWWARVGRLMHPTLDDGWRWWPR